MRDADFRRAADQARQEINQFIAEQTAGKIRDLLSPGVVSAATSLVLASAVYLKAAWAHPFPAGATQDAVFYLGSGQPDPGQPDPGQPGSGRARASLTLPAGPGTQVRVPTMRLRARLRYLRGDGYQAVELPYASARLGMVIVLPDPPPGPGSGGPAGGPVATRGPLAGDPAGAAWAACWPGWRRGRSAWRCRASR